MAEHKYVTAEEITHLKKRILDQSFIYDVHEKVELIVSDHVRLLSDLEAMRQTNRELERDKARLEAWLEDVDRKAYWALRRIPGKVLRELGIMYSDGSSLASYLAAIEAAMDQAGKEKG